MRSKKYRVCIITALTIFWMGVIFYFSAQPAVQSAGLSGGLFRRICDFVAEIPVMGHILAGGFTEHLLRKSAHMAEFAVLGSLLMLGMYEYIPEYKRVLRFPAALAAGIFYAGTDEFHQRFVPGRSGELRDVMIDSVGVLVGVLLISVIFAYVSEKSVIKKREVYGR